MVLHRNRKVTIGLAVAVLAIWGYVIYKIAWGRAQTTAVAVKNERSNVEPEDVYKSYVLSSYDRDPFLSIKDTMTEETLPPPSRTPLPVPVAVVKKVPLPEYNGVIQNKGEKLAILKIDSQFHLLKTGETLGDLRIRSFNNDYLIILIKGTTYKIALTRSATNAGYE
jgi:hypothetical protein